VQLLTQGGGGRGRRYLVIDRSLRLATDMVHHTQRLEWIVTLGSLPAQHNTVSTVQDSVSHVAGLGSSWPRLFHHRLQHLKTKNHPANGLPHDGEFAKRNSQNFRK